MVRLLEKMQTYQGDLVMKDINAALPEGMRVLPSEDIDRSERQSEGRVRRGGVVLQYQSRIHFNVA